MFRKILFWTHLVCGVAAGLVILIMSLTGVLLTYERQMVAWADNSHEVEPAADAVRQPIATLLAAAKAHQPDFAPTSVTVVNDPEATVTISAGRAGTLFVDPYTGEVFEQGSKGMREFFSAVTSWHRWLSIEGDNRAMARTITGASNLLFLFLVVSGIYLWLPRMYKWALFKSRLLFNPKAGSGKARDFNWHHVFGIWSAIPLIVIVASGVVFSYPWANALVYRSVGEDPPVRGAGRGGPGGPGGGGERAGAPGGERAGGAGGERAGGPGGERAVGPGGERAGGPGGGRERAAGPASGGEGERAGGPGRGRPDALQASQAAIIDEAIPFDDLVARAAQQTDSWRAITLNLPNEAGATTVRLGIDQGNGGQPQRRHNLTLDAHSGAVAAWQPFSSQTTGQQARSWIRSLHTGEALGVLGQTVAGLVSLASVLMVWTGLALAYRRLIAPWFVRRPTTARRA